MNDQRLGRLLHPARLVAVAFAVLMLLGTLVLLLPYAKAGKGGTDLVTAIFTSVSAVSVTGLSTVDFSTYWTPLGQATILLLIQVGGLGILTLTSVSVILLSHRLGLRQRLQAQREGNLNGDSIARTVKRIVLLALGVEAAAALALTIRYLTLGEPLGTSIWRGVFHAVSSFTGAGFALQADSLVSYAHDPWILVPLGLAALVGSLGFPVIFEVARRVHPRRWSLHTKITLTTTGVLLLVGTVLLFVLEYTNKQSIGNLGLGEKAWAALYASLMPRSAGFNAIDYSTVRDSSLLVTDVLMFIGGGSASTAGGIKVTTFALLALVVWAELRGESDVTAFKRRIPASAGRQALTIALLSVGVVATATILLESTTPLPLSPILFEVTSAFATNGLSAGITPSLPPHAQIILSVVMYLGRIGPLTLGAALVLRDHTTTYRYPEERTLVG